jgi:hypothetical protein
VRLAANIRVEMRTQPAQFFSLQWRGRAESGGFLNEHGSRCFAIPRRHLAVVAERRDRYFAKPKITVLHDCLKFFQPAQLVRFDKIFVLLVIVADRWQVVLAFAGFRWTRDKANRHFFFSGDTGSGKTSGMNGLVAALIRRNPTLGGVIMANKGDEWFYLEWLAKKYGREKDIIRLRPRLVGETDTPLHRLNVNGDARFPFTTRARMLVDTAAALNPKDEKNFFKMKGAAHIGRALELLADIGRPVTATNAYDLLTSETELKAALDQLTKVEPTLRRARLSETFEQTYINHQAKEQRAGLEKGVWLCSL